MTDVLLIAGTAPPAGLLSTAVQRLREAGARVYVAGALPPEQLSADLEIDGVHPLPGNLAQSSTRRAAVGVTPGERVWMRIRRERGVRKIANTADVLVALDKHAVYTVWELAQRNLSAEACFGLAAALRAVRARDGSSAPWPPRKTGAVPPPAVVKRSVKELVRSAPQTAVAAVTPRPLMRSGLGTRLWVNAVQAPRLSDAFRAKVAEHVAQSMRWAERPDGEALILSAAAEKLSKPTARAKMLRDAANRELRAGIPPRNLETAVKALLALADSYQREGKFEAAARQLDHAMKLAFHRVLHIDQLTSPLAQDPEGFVAPFRKSQAAALVAQPRGRARSFTPPPADRPLRLLVATSANDNFLKLIIERYQAHPGVEVRFLDLAADPGLKRTTWDAKSMLEHRLTDGTRYGRIVEQRLREHLDWADTIFVDWCVAPAALFTMVDPGTTRIVIRLHSYEALSRWVHMIDFSRVDDLVFVADHIRDLTVSLVPHLQTAESPRTHVLHNAMDLANFVIDKDPEARFNIGMVGIGQVAKDPLWAVDVIRRLRESDDRYRLLLVGADMNPDVSVATRDYLDAFNRELADLEASGAVLRLGPTNDVPKALTRIGTILSSSVREGSHCGLQEGAASGAVPVVRDWPFFARQPNGPRTLYPQEWVVDTPDQAAARILLTTATEEVWRKTGSAASAYALGNWDWSVVRNDFDQLFLNRD